MINSVRMKSDKPIIIVLGPQGSGKGTQGKVLAKKLDIPYLETGQLLRDEIASGSEEGKYISSVIDDGTLLPDEYISKFMTGKIAQSVESSGGIIVDGFPRSNGQADAFEGVVNPTHAILVDIPDEESIRRLSARRRCIKDNKIYNLITNPPKNNESCDICGGQLEQRVDDTPEAIKHRLDQYHRDTEPLIQRYESMGVLHKIDGMPSIEEVEKSVWEIFS
jgi:adenylate kinase